MMLTNFLRAACVAVFLFLLAPDRARAGDDACGALSGNAITCSDQAYATGILYNDASPIAVTIPGGSSTTITSDGNGGWFSAIVIQTAAGTTADVRDIELNVGTTGNAVAIVQSTNTSADTWYNHRGIFALQQVAGTIDINVGNQVTIGTSTLRMRQHGIHAGLRGSNAPAVAGNITITSGAAIYATKHGIALTNNGPGASTVTNTGAIDASQQGIHVEDTGSAGAVTVTNSGTITAAWQGIFAKAGGTGKDAAGTNAGVSVTHTAGAITSSGNRGIQVLVGTSRQERNTGHADYVAPVNTGIAKVEVTGGSISASSGAIEAINYEAGGVDVDVSSGVTVTSSTGSGIYAGLHDVGNTSGAIDVDNAGEITAAVTGIWVGQNGAANTVSVSVDNEGDIKKTGSGAGYGIRVDQSGNGDITIVNSGDIGDATTQHVHGIWLPNPGSGDSTVTNNGGHIRASQRGIHVEDTGSAGAVTVTNSGTITAAGIGIRATTTGKDAEGANAGVTVTHSGDAIASSGDIGISAHVGERRGTENDDTSSGYVAPENTGLVKVEVTGGSIRSKWRTIEAINFEAGSVEVEVSSGVTLTTTDRDHAIFALVADVANTDGTVTVTNAGTIDVDAENRHGIFAVRAAGSGAVTVTNSGAIASDGGMGIFADVGAVTVTNSAAITSELSGIFARTASNDVAGANVGVSVTHSGGAIEANGRGIRARVGAERQEIDASHADYVAPVNTGLVKVSVTGGSISSIWPAIEALNYEAGSIDIDIAAGATLTSTANSAIHAQLTDVGNARGTITIKNAGMIEAAVSGVFSRIVAGSGDMTITNSGAIKADSSALFLLGTPSYAGNIMLTNSGALSGKADARAFRGILVAHDGERGTVTVANSGDIRAKDYGILASVGNGLAGRGVTITHSGGAIDVDSATDAPVLDSQKHGIVARVGNWNQETDPDHDDYVAPRGAGAVKVSVTGGSIASRGTAVEGANYEGGGVEIAIASGVTLSSAREHGIEADLRDVGNTGGTIDITQAGTISARGDGISARVTRSSPAPLDRPVIEIDWTGSFTTPEPQTGAESVLFVAQAMRTVQAAQAVEAVEALRGGSAGIDAGVMKWQTFMGVVSDGDDPGAFADAAAQAALFADSADAATQARAAAIIAQFRSTLTAGTLGSIRDAGDVDTDDDKAYSDEEIVAYLSEDSDARRILLRNVLKDSLTDREMAVFRAVITDGDVDAALAAVPDSYTDAWKSKVSALVNSHNDGNIRIAVDGGSIVSPGDGIRAFYAKPHDGNGAISVTIADGATVTGGTAGVYVANAGLDADDILNQRVTVDGTVTGGEDAAVHLAGGGRLTVGRTGQVLAGSSGRAILVNDPGEAIIVIEGTVRGSATGQGDEPAPAAVHLTGGGEVTISLTGRVEANGAELAILSENKPTRVLLHVPGDRLTRENADEALARVQGGIGGSIVGARDGGVNQTTLVLIETDDGKTTGHYTDLPIVGNNVVTDVLPTSAFTCAWAEDGRCRLYEALPSALLAMNVLPSYGERMEAARDGNGGWARVEGASGEWKAKSSTQENVAFDYRRYGVQAGVDFAVGGGGRFGVSVRGLQGSAELEASGGEVDVSGVGAGAHGTAFPGGGFHVDAQAMATWYDVKLTSGTKEVLKDGAKGLGLALGMEVGRRMDVGDALTVTPVAGLTWSDVSLDFTDEVGSGALVSVEDAQSLQGRAGVRVEAQLGGLRLFGSVEATHEFSDERTAKASGEALKTTEAQKTGARAGLGGVCSWEDGRYALRAGVGYAARGDGNGEFDGDLSFTVRF